MAGVMSMYEWLEREVATIKTRKFHVFEGLDPQSERASRGCAFPPSYERFVHQFGGAKLYRMLGYYLIGVLATPQAETTPDGERYYRIGHYDSDSAYFRTSQLAEGNEAPVWEPAGGEFRVVGDSFDAWLESRCAAARQRYKGREWAQILAGPAPFTSEERRIVDARREFKWRVIGSTPDGKVRFEVRNDSDMVLPFLSIGVRAKNGAWTGGVWLPVATIPPKQTAVVEKDCHGGTTSPSEIEFFNVPDPESEDRDRYWEFRPVT